MNSSLPYTSQGSKMNSGPSTNLEKADPLEVQKHHLRKKLASSEYRTLAGVILDSAGVVIQKATRRERPVSFWVSAGALALAVFLIGTLISLVLGEGLGNPLLFQFSAWAAGMGSLILIANKVMIDIFLSTFRGSPLEAIKSPSDLKHLESWLDRNFAYRLPLIFSVLAGPFLGYFLFEQWIQANHQLELTYGPLFIAAVAATEAAIAIYYLYPFYLVLPNRLSGYRFDLYKADPSSSVVTRQLSDLFTVIMYITLAYIILITISFGYFRVLNERTVLFLGLFVWAPTVLLYIGCQYNLSKIIKNAKWGTLIKIQAKIEKLMTEQEPPPSASLEYLEKLMNYHDRIRNSPNSALNFRAGLNAINTLLLPLITLILANWSTVQDFFFPPR